MAVVKHLDNKLTIAIILVLFFILWCCVIGSMFLTIKDNHENNREYDCSENKSGELTCTWQTAGV